MCVDDQGFTTVVGPRRSVLHLLDGFTQLAAADRHDLHEAPVLIDFKHVSATLLDDESPAVAVLHHPASRGIAVAAQLQAETLVGDPSRKIPALPELLWEPGYEFRAAAAGQGPHVWIDPRTRPRLTKTVPAIPAAECARGLRVAVLDTGSRSAGNDMVDFTGFTPVVAPTEDDNGHGEAVTQLIQAVRPDADIYPLRVLGPQTQTGPSYQVLAGLSLALWSDEYDVVNASLTSVAGSPCEQSFGRSIDYLIQMCSGHGRHVPRLVAAAGNGGPATRAGYPATAPTAVVAMAMEHDPSGFVPARYNPGPAGRRHRCQCLRWRGEGPRRDGDRPLGQRLVALRHLLRRRRSLRRLPALTPGLPQEIRRPSTPRWSGSLQRAAPSARYRSRNLRPCGPEVRAKDSM